MIHIEYIHYELKFSKNLECKEWSYLKLRSSLHSINLFKLSSSAEEHNNG